MSCTTPKLVSYYSDKVNIYTSDCFIPLPAWRTCPPPSMVMTGPGAPACGPCGPMIAPMAEPLYPPRPYVGAYTSNSSCGGGCGPCGK